MQSIDNVLKLRKGLKPDDPNPDIFDVLWAKKLSGAGKDYTVTGNPLDFTAKKAQTAKSTKVTMEPMQDLHGYDNPWPAGGGINMCNPESMLPGYISGADGNIIRQTASKEYYCKDYIPISGICISVGYNAFASEEVKWIAVAFYDSEKNFISRPASLKDIDLMAIPNNAVFARPTMRTYDHGLQYCYSAVGNIITFSPYSNICPISGRSSVEIKGCGKNFFRFTNSRARYEWSDGCGFSAISNGDSSITFHGTASATRPFSVSNATLELKKGTYTASLTNYGIRVEFTRSDIVEENPVAVINDSSVTFTITEDIEIATTIIVKAGSSFGTSTVIGIQIESGNTATEYKSYAESNDVTITFPALGHNQWDEQWEHGGISSTTGLNTTGEDNVKCRAKNYISISPETSYYLCKTNPLSANVFYIAYYDVNKDFIVSDITGAYNRTITTPSNCYYMRFWLGSYAFPVTSIDNDISINYPATFTAYEPHTNTVYGGTLDVEQGEVVVDKILLQNASTGWSYESTWSVFYRTLTGYDKDVSPQSNMYKSATGAPGAQAAYNKGNDTICVKNLGTTNVIYIRDDAYNNADAFMAAIADIQIVYQLATPRTITLTPEQIQILKGNNTLWIEDGGATIALTYKK